jgi:aspartate 1-decarboxylase
VILATYAAMEEEEARKHQPMVILVDENNRIKETYHEERPLTLSA